MMMLPPMIMRLRIGQEGHRGFSLWLPLFLILPIVLLFALAAYVLALAGAILLLRWRWVPFIFISPLYIYRCICALKGLQVNVEKPSEHVLIRFK